jgi:cardiolipin-specific phospholipase
MATETPSMNSEINLTTTRTVTSSATANPDGLSSHRKPTNPSGVPLSQISPKLFPLSFSESFKDYMKKGKLLDVQDELLSSLPFYPEPSKTHSAKVIKFESSNSLVFPDINEFHVKPIREKTSSSPSNEKHLVIMHGYGAGLGFFIKNIESLAQRHPDWHIHAIDLPGYGCSTRVDFPSNIPTENHETVEKLFTIPLRDWFVARGLDEKNTITVAHSMGGYFSLLLQMYEVNGNGYINENEFNFLKKRMDFFNKKKANLQNERFERQRDLLSSTSENPRRFWDTLVLVSPGGIFDHRTEDIAAKIPNWFTHLWNRNISPFSLVRNTGPLGSLFVSGWTSRRFAIDNLIDEKLRTSLHRYAYGIFNAKGSGEYMLNYILAPGAVPRHPLLHRLEQIKHYAGNTVWLYGSHDWMDEKAGYLASKKLRDISPFRSEYGIVPDAGHHIYLDAFEKFNDIISKQMDGMDRK